IIKERARSSSRHGDETIERSSTYIDDETVVSEGKHTDPKHRNTRMIQAGVAGATLAGLARARSRSRSKSRRGSRSQSLVKDAATIAAAGIGSAAATGAYEKFRSNQEEKRARSRSRSYSRSRSRSAPPSSRRRDAALVEYGEEPIFTERERAR